jgi:cell division protein FtsB
LVRTTSAARIDLCVNATSRTPTAKFTNHNPHNFTASDSDHPGGTRPIPEFRQDKRIHAEYRKPSHYPSYPLPDSGYQVCPLQEQIQHFQSEFQRLNLQVSELTSTKAKLSDEVEQLKVRAHSAEDRLEKMSSEFEEFVHEAAAREQYVAESRSSK